MRMVVELRGDLIMMFDLEGERCTSNYVGECAGMWIFLLLRFHSFRL